MRIHCDCLRLRDPKKGSPKPLGALRRAQEAAERLAAAAGIAAPARRAGVNGIAV